MCLSNPYLSVAVRMCVLYAFCMVVPDTCFDVFGISGSSSHDSFHVTIEDNLCGNI